MKEIIEERRNIAITRTSEIIEKARKAVAELDYDTMPLIYFMPKITDSEEIISKVIMMNKEIESLYGNIFSLYDFIEELKKNEK